MILSVNSDEFNYDLQCGLPIPSASVFARDPEVKEETLWHGEKRRPGSTLLERRVGSVWIVNHDSVRISYPAILSQSESVLPQLQEPHLYPELSSLRHEMQKL